MALPYPTKVVLPFDIATAQDMNERHANDVALANGSGLDDGAVTSDKIDSATYSTTEKVVGTWTDGKPIYRRVVSFTATTDSTNYSHGISIDTPLSIFGIRDGVTTMPELNPSSLPNSTGIWLRYDGVRVRAGSSVSLPFDVTAIIEYTKTS